MEQKELRSRVLAAIRRTYEAIAGDLQAACEEHGEEFTLEDAVECTLDADRVLTFGGDKEAAEALYAITGWSDMKRLGRDALKEYF